MYDRTFHAHFKIKTKINIRSANILAFLESDYMVVFRGNAQMRPAASVRFSGMLFTPYEQKHRIPVRSVVLQIDAIQVQQTGPSDERQTH